MSLYVVVIAVLFLIGCAKESDVTFKFISETSGTGFQNDHVKITNQDGGKTYTRYTNSRGEVKFDSVPHGKYKMTFICHANEPTGDSGGYAQTREVNIKGFTFEREYKVKPLQSSHPNRSVLIYTLFESNKKNINDAEVKLTNLSTQAVLSQRTTYGSAVFIEVPRGNYRLTISHPAISTFEREISVNSNFMGEYRLN